MSDHSRGISSRGFRLFDALPLPHSLFEIVGSEPRAGSSDAGPVAGSELGDEAPPTSAMRLGILTSLQAYSHDLYNYGLYGYDLFGYRQ